MPPRYIYHTDGAGTYIANDENSLPTPLGPQKTTGLGCSIMVLVSLNCYFNNK